MGTKERREREKAETRTLILDAAREMFATRGIEATTMRAIADRIEYTPTAIYYHFRDKDELIRELCHTDFRMLAQSFGRIGRIEDPIERLSRIGEAYVRFADELPNHYRIMFMTTTPAPSQEGRGNPEEDAYEFLRQTVEEAIQIGRLRPEFDDSDHVAQLIWAGVHGVISLRLAKCKDPWVEWSPMGPSARDMMDVMMRGMLREG